MAPALIILAVAYLLLSRQAGGGGPQNVTMAGDKPAQKGPSLIDQLSSIACVAGGTYVAGPAGGAAGAAAAPICAKVGNAAVNLQKQAWAEVLGPAKEIVSNSTVRKVGVAVAKNIATAGAYSVVKTAPMVASGAKNVAKGVANTGKEVAKSVYSNTIGRLW